MVARMQEATLLVARKKPSPSSEQSLLQMLGIG